MLGGGCTAAPKKKCLHLNCGTKKADMGRSRGEVSCRIERESNLIRLIAERKKEKGKKTG